MTRRELMRGAASAALPSFAQAQSSGRPSDAYRNYFGDLHNHNDVGYAQGSLTRSFEVARNHLDFYAFTPHSYWPDVGHYDGKIENKWKHGLAVAKSRWPDVVELARQYDEPGEFVTILGYERHGAAEGDYHILFPDLAGDYELIEDLRELQAFAKRRGCIMVPHHLQTGSATAHFFDQHRRSSRLCSRSIPSGATPSTTARRALTSATPKAAAGPSTRCTPISNKAIAWASSPARTTISATPAATAKASPSSRRRS
ncbi:MAG: hypothetical protein R2724_01310 [Bryobacterales bacterium]